MVDMTTVTLVTPIGAARREQVVAATRDCLRRLRRILECELPPIPVRFDLRGRSAGMFRIRNGAAEIRYNPYLFARYFRENMESTVPHEAAHYAVDRVHGRRVRPHGAEWRALMIALGVAPEVRASFDMAGIPVRRTGRHLYRCGCGEHLLSAIRHGRVLRGGCYTCRSCGMNLSRVGEGG